MTNSQNVSREYFKALLYLITFCVIVVFLAIAVGNVFACGGGGFGCGMADHKHDSNAKQEPNTTAEKAKAAEQTLCPVMGGKINKDIFTEYKGKKVYFCCPGCKPVFEKDPEKYIDKLPQFAK